MKTIVEPAVLKNMLGQVLIAKSGSVFKNVTTKFDSKGLMIRDMSLGVLGIAADYSKAYFLDYVCDDANGEVVVLTDSLLEKLGWGLKDEKIAFATDGDEIVLEGGKDTYKEKLMNPGTIEFPVDLVESKEKGLLPVDMEETSVISILMKNTDLVNLPTADYYKLKCDGQTITFELGDTQKSWKTKIVPERVEKVGAIEVNLDGSYLRKIAANLNDTFWLLVIPDAVVFANKKKDMALTYLMTTSSVAGA